MRFPNRLVLSAMAGINDWSFVIKQKAGFVILGGFNADRKSNEAAMMVVKRGRKEFVFSKPLNSIEEQLKRTQEFEGVVGVNVRSASIDGYVEVAKIASEFDAVLEINAHCRQKEFLNIGCGQMLMFDAERLAKVVEKTSKYTVTSVKIRGGLDLNYEKLASIIFESGASFLHVDAMIQGEGSDLNLVKSLSSLGFVIGNNSVVDVTSARMMLDAGAKLVSSARAVLKDARFFEKLLQDRVLSSPLEVV